MSTGAGPVSDPGDVSEVVEVVELTSAETHDLRRRVLRENRHDASVRWAGDDDVGTVHLGIRIDGVVVAVSTWLTSDVTAGGTPRTIQLRGMATEPDRAGAGLGGRLLRAGIARAERLGAELVWANARRGALAFYRRAGFTPVGDEFVVSDIVPGVGLPHRRIEYPISVSAD